MYSLLAIDETTSARDGHGIRASEAGFASRPQVEAEMGQGWEAWALVWQAWGELLSEAAQRAIERGQLATERVDGYVLAVLPAALCPAEGGADAVQEGSGGH